MDDDDHLNLIEEQLRGALGLHDEGESRRQARARIKNHVKLYESQSNAAGRCPCCNDFGKRMLYYGLQPRVAFDASPLDLQESASKCRFCGIVFAALQQFEPEIGKITDDVNWIYAKRTGAPSHMTLMLEIYFKDPRPKLELEIYAGSYADSENTQGVVAFTTQSYEAKTATSDTSLRWVQSRLRDCLRNHPKCSMTLSSSLPRRILKLKRNADGLVQVVLQETNGALGRYACLSHRWGGSESCITTQETYAERLQGIPWSFIPPTFRDVINFTLFLGIDLIWIDSLCIIQNDSADWKDQASQMASIYQNSCITLAATTSANNETGCFWKADGLARRPFSTKAGKFSVQKTMKHWERMWTSNSVAVFPLLSRAWVFQERLLAPRMLYFSHNELVWECLEDGKCQCGRYQQYTNPKMQNWTSSKSWRRAVELYTSLELTMEKDRLPALYGFANFYASATGVSIDYDYFSGLWKQSLLQDLLWRVDSLSQSSQTGVCGCLKQARSAGGAWVCQSAMLAGSSSAWQSQKEAEMTSGTSTEDPYSLRNMSEMERQKSEPMITLKSHTIVKIKNVDDIPSWSWVSARTRVKYWDNVLKGSGSSAARISSHLQGYEWNLVGFVSSGLLKASGQLTMAELRYESHPQAFNRATHDIYGYSVLMYGNKKVEFHADYILCFEGGRWIPEQSSVYILHVIDDVYLVLKDKRHFQLDAVKRLKESFEPSSARPSPYVEYTSTVGERFVRIGILRTPFEFRATDRTQWLSNIEIE